MELEFKLTGLKKELKLVQDKINKLEDTEMKLEDMIYYVECLQTQTLPEENFNRCDVGDIECYIDELNAKLLKKRIIAPVGYNTYIMFCEKYGIISENKTMQEMKKLIKDYEISNNIENGLYF